MILYHYSVTKFDNLTTAEYRGSKVTEDMIKMKRPYTPGFYNQHISFFFDPVPFQLLGKLYGKDHKAWYPGSKLFQYIVDSEKIGDFAYHIVETPEAIEMVFDDTIEPAEFHRRFSEIAEAKKYIGKGNIELEHGSRKFIGKTREYFTKASKMEQFDSFKEKYAACVPHVMLYPKTGIVKYEEVSNIVIR